MKPGSPSRTKNLLKVLTQAVLLFAGFIFLLFTESSKNSGVSSIPGATGGVANADAPSSESSFSSGK